MSLVEFHQLVAVHGPLLLQRDELSLRGVHCLIADLALNKVQIVCTNSHQCSAAAQVLVELVLAVNERSVQRRSELNSAEDSRNYERSNLRC